MDVLCYYACLVDLCSGCFGVPFALMIGWCYTFVFFCCLLIIDLL